VIHRGRVALVRIQRRVKTRKRTMDDTGWALKSLIKARVGHLASSTRDGKPLVVPICFACRDATIYSAIDQKVKRRQPLALRRVLNIVENPRVCLLVDDYDEDWRKLRYVIVQGTATLLNRGREHRTALCLLRKKYRQYRYMKLENRPVIKIKPVRTIAWRATPPESQTGTVKPKEYH